MNIIITVLVFFLSTTYLISNDTDISINKVKVMKRNKPTCNRLGNIYDACQWMMRFSLYNNSKNKVDNYCFNLSVDKKVYELCLGRMKKFSLKSGHSKTFLINLTEKMNIDMESQKPIVKILLK